jgi:hypothetical protein
MKDDAGVSRLGILFGITLAALVALILWEMRPRPRWEYPIHIVFQSVHPDAIYPDDPADAAELEKQKKKLADALAALPPDPQDSKKRMYNVLWKKKAIPPLIGDEKQGKASKDTDGGFYDDTKPYSHVTQQVSFKTVAELQKFLNDAGIE